MTRPAPPRSAGELTKRVRAYANSHEIAEGRVRLWVAHLAIIGALTRDADSEAGSLVMVKGGVAVEQWLGSRARATKDLDLTLNVPDTDMVDTVDERLGIPFGAFTFRRSGEPYRMPNGAARIRVAVQYMGRAWSTVQVDLSDRELDGVGAESVDALSLSELGLSGPSSVPCLPISFQIAQKLHAFTDPSAESDERVRDVVDVLLLRELIGDYASLRLACTRLFESRATHGWPPEVHASERANAEYRRLAKEVDFPIAHLEEALNELRGFIARIG